MNTPEDEKKYNMRIAKSFLRSKRNSKNAPKSSKCQEEYEEQVKIARYYAKHLPVLYMFQTPASKKHIKKSLNLHHNILNWAEDKIVLDI